MNAEEETPVEDPEREARVRRARRSVLVLGFAFYILLIMMCLTVFIVIFAVRR